jgi:antitoxin FitA
MPAITIRDIDDTLKDSLRLRAARHRRSMEEEARQILRAALQGERGAAGADMVTRIRARFTALGDVALPLVAREPIRQPPDFGSARKPAPARKAPATRRK